MKHCEVMLYPADGWSVDKIVEVIDNRASVKEYCLVLHDKDLEEDGKPKKPHYHCYLNFGTTNCTVEHIAKWFNTTPEMVQYIKAKKDGKYYVLRYYQHLDYPDKHRYSLDEVTANFDVAAFWESEQKKIQEKQNLKAVLNKCANGEITRLNYFERISVETFTAHKPKIERAWELYEQKQKQTTENQRTTSTVYVYGESGVGKTLSCKLFAQSAGLTVYTTTPGKNPFDEYRGEAAIILDEIRPSEPFTHHELLKMLDPYNSSMAPARYANKYLHNSHYFLTSVFSPEEFWQGFGLAKRDSAKQFYRRLAEVWRVTETEILIYKYLDGEFKQIAVLNNPAVQFLAKQKSAPKLSTQDIFQKVFADMKRDASTVVKEDI